MTIDLEAIKRQLEPVTDAQKVELYDLEFLVEHGRKILRLYIEQEEGISLNDCERVSRAVEMELDRNDPIPEAYVLEVSSPGIERKLVKTAHFEKNIGKPVAVRLKKPVFIGNTNQKNFRAVLKAIEEDMVVITISDKNKTEDLRLSRENLVHCRLVYIERLIQPDAIALTNIEDDAKAESDA